MSRDKPDMKLIVEHALMVRSAEEQLAALQREVLRLKKKTLLVAGWLESRADSGWYLPGKSEDPVTAEWAYKQLAEALDLLGLTP